MRFFLLNVFTGIAISILNAQTPTSVKAAELKRKIEKTGFSSSICFTENKGQVSDQNYKPRPDVLFGGMAGGMAFHLRNNGISYQLNRVDTWKEEEPALKVGRNLKTKEKRKVADQSTIYRLDINWIGTNNNFTTKTEKPLAGYSNYYLAVCPNGINNVKSYQGVFYNNIYNNINLHYYQKNGCLKYDYIVAPHANYKQIQMQVTGANKITVQKNGALEFTTPLGNIEEGAPIVYQNGKQLPAKWIISKSDGGLSRTISFEIKNYNSNLELVIDPAIRVWGIFYGGTGNEYGNGCATDATGNVYLSGYTTPGTGTAIATLGSQQSVFGGGNVDDFLAKFNSSGVRQWGTYYGDIGYDYGSECATDTSGNVYLTGYTDAATGTVIATAGSHQSVYGGGGYDAFLVKFNSAGVRQWGTYYGGIGFEKGLGCATDIAGNVYLAGLTYASTGTTIATPGSHQSVFSGGDDAFLVKFNSSGVRQWGTYYGGSAYDQGFGCASDVAGNIYLAGNAASTGTSISTTGSHQFVFAGGNYDSFLAKFNSAGVRQWGTYYGGIGDDYGNGCATDATGNVYLVGYTDASTGTIIATAGSHQSVFSGGQVDAFLAKFNSAGVRQWGTYYGDTGYDYGQACATDATGNVYLAGYTNANSSTVIATALSQQSVNGGSYDAFLAKFNSIGVRQWGTFYGGLSVEYGNGCATDAVGNVYLAGFTNGSTGTSIATTGSHQSFFGGGSYDAFLVKFTDCVALNPMAMVNNTLCFGASINFTAGIAGTATPMYLWAGPNTFTSAIQNPSIAGASTVNIGTYTLTINNGGCIETTTTSVNFINPIPTITVNSGAICAGNSFTIVPGGASTYTFSSGSPVVTPTANASYNVSGATFDGCISATSAISNVTVDALPLVNIVSNLSLICAGQSATLTANGASTYSWNTGATTAFIVVTPTVTTPFTLNGTDSNGCSNVATVTQNVSDCTGIQIFAANPSFFNVYPNPSRGEFIIQSDRQLSIKLTNALGQTVLIQNLESGKTLINISGQASGIYFLKANSSSIKVIKQ